MVKIIYIERDLLKSSITKSIINKLGKVEMIVCEKYTDVFNKKSQNFRIQKKQPSLILAKKKKNFLNRIPSDFSIGGDENYYFSHILNCIYDCKYCFLRGMFNSANYVLFTNFDDFKKEIQKIFDKNKNKKIHFFSGYDCDSLAMERITGFADNFVDFFKNKNNFLLELRTKSTQIKSLLYKKANLNTVIAYSLNPQEIITNFEDKTPSLNKRIFAIQRLQKVGWKVGLRFDPVIFVDEYRSIYGDFFNKIFKSIEIEKIHSVTLGVFRMPSSFFHRIENIYDNKFKFNKLEKINNKITLEENVKREVIDFCKEKILKFLPSEKVFIN